jgi:hypothetical protein
MTARGKRTTRGNTHHAAALTLAPGEQLAVREPGRRAATHPGEDGPDYQVQLLVEGLLIDGLGQLAQLLLHPQ